MDTAGVAPRTDLLTIGMREGERERERERARERERERERERRDESEREREREADHPSLSKAGTPGPDRQQRARTAHRPGDDSRAGAADCRRTAMPAHRHG